MSDRRSYRIGAGWKMNKTLAELLDSARAPSRFEGLDHPVIRSVVVPPCTSLRQVMAGMAPASVLVGAQNMHREVEGAFTDEVSAAMPNDRELDQVELGHSERRACFGESEGHVGRKVEVAVRAAWDVDTHLETPRRREGIPR